MDIFKEPDEEFKDFGAQTEGDKSKIFQVMRQHATDLIRRCHKHANVDAIASIDVIHNLSTFKIRGIYSDDRSEQDITFLEYVTRTFKFIYTLIKA